MAKNKNYESLKNDITQSELKSQFDYDAEDGVLIKKFRNGKPYNRVCGNKPDCRGYGQIRINRKKYATHRLIWLYHYGEFPSEFIDHIDGDKMNNRIENLREVDQVVNGHNHKFHKNNKSGFSNVSWDKKKEMWRVQMCIYYKRIFVGYYRTMEEAIHAAKLAKIKYHPTSPVAKKYAEELGISIQ